MPISEHVALGLAIEIGVSEIAGGPQKYPAGIVSTALVAAFKEGSDAEAERDTKRSAAIDALEILTGAGIAAAVRH